MKVSLITKDEIKKLQSMIADTECEELVQKLHSSYNSVLIHAFDLKRKNNDLIRSTKRKRRFTR